MVLRSRLQPEMAQGPDPKRGLVAYRYAIDSRLSSVHNSYRTLRMISPVWLSVVLQRRNHDRSSILTKILPARYWKVSTTKRSISWILRSLATAILAG